MIDAGQLRHRVEIQSRTTTRGTRGQETGTWATVATVWAKVEPLSGAEVTQARQQFASASHRVTIRYYAGLTPKHRFLFGDRALNIEFVQNTEERNVEHVCTCGEEI